MAFHDDYRWVMEHEPGRGDIVAFLGTQSTEAPLLPAGHTAVLEFAAAEGDVNIHVESLDARDPTQMRRVGPLAEAEFVEEWNRLPFTVELFGADGLLETWRIGINGWHRESASEFRHRFPAGGTWKVQVTNDGRVQARVLLYVGFVILRTPKRTLPLSLSLLNHAYRIILDAMTPSARAIGDRIEWSFGAEIKAHAGSASDSLGIQSKKLPDGLSAYGRMDKFSLRACAGQEALDAARRRWAERDADFADSIGREALRAANDRWLQDWQARISANQPTVHAAVAFTDIVWSYETSLWIVDLKTSGILDDVTVDVYLAFEPTLTAGTALVLSPAKFVGGVLDLAEDLGIIEELGGFIEEELTAVLEHAAARMGRFLGEALARLLGKGAMFMHVLATGSTFDVTFAQAPPPGWPPPGWRGVPLGVLGGGLDLGRRPVLGSNITVDRDAEATRGSIPPEFVVHAPETLAALDQVDTIVVLMMENRSFDHMLGHLAHMPDGERYAGFTGGESNRVSNRQEAVRLRPATEVMQGVRDRYGRPVPPTAIQISPQHDTRNVADQIAGGAMSGFAQDVEERSTGAADLVMTFYTAAELPTYYALAQQFLVCDHWFAAHPGGTWPNRWATLSGRSPSTENPPIDDPDIAYVAGETLFSRLSTYGIEWRVFESDLSLIRTYNRHRLDAERVQPLGAPPREGIGLGEGTSFWDLAARGILPPVVFVEPNFSDIPPLATANDDLAPVDLRKGQALVATIVDALTRSPQWPRTMLIITYDEHGGFYDHVPPPGTPLGPPEWLGKVPPITEGGPDHLGVRVPTLVVSPLVAPGSVSSVVFDHTAIIKTILLRHRAVLFPGAFTAFGERVNQSAHLGQVLDTAAPRVAPPTTLAARFAAHARPPVREERLGASPEAVVARTVGDSNSDVAALLRAAFMPR